MIHDTKTNDKVYEIQASELEILKDEEYVEYMCYRMMKDAGYMFTEEYVDEIMNNLDESETETDKALSPGPNDEKVKTLVSDRGFYVGDPALVLRDKYLDNGIRQGKTIQAGHYEIEGLKAIICPASVGEHCAHDIYSGTIGVIPLELVDSEKLKRLPADELDIRMGDKINVMVKGSKMYLSQGFIDEIEMMETDDVYYNNDIQMGI